MATKKYKIQMPLTPGHSCLLHDHCYQSATFHYCFFFSKLRPNSRKCFAPLLSGLDRSYFPISNRKKKHFFPQLPQSSNLNPARQNQMCPSNAHAWTHTNLQGLAA